jgi:hypothetical protein
MRIISAFAIGLSLILAVPSLSTAAVLAWSGTLRIGAPLASGQEFVHIGAGVATVNGSGGLGHLDTIRFAGGLSYTGGNNVPESIPLTNPDNATLITLRATGLRVGMFTLNGISGGPPLGTKNTGIPPGHMKACILFPGCGNYLPIPFGTVSGNRGVGVGGLWTVNTFSKGHGFKISVSGAPWSIGVASIQNVTTVTPNGAVTTYTRTAQGFVHGPVSATSATARAGGVVQLVTPMRLKTSLGAPDTYEGIFMTLTIHFVPEPSTLLLVAGGLGALALGRRRRRM